MSYDVSNLGEINSRINSLVQRCSSALTQKGFSQENIKHEVYLNLRYEKTDFSLMTACEESGGGVVLCDPNNYVHCFEQQYRREFGFTIPDRSILVDDIRVRGVGSINQHFLPSSSTELDQWDNSSPTILDYTKCYFESEGFVQTPIYLFDSLRRGHCVNGPAMIIDSNSTMVIEPFCRACVTRQGNILVQVESGNAANLTTQLDPIYLSIFSHVFMSIAEQMGCVLQHTAISTNIKERLDFSCAIFGPAGHLVSHCRSLAMSFETFPLV